MICNSCCEEKEDSEFELVTNGKWTFPRKQCRSCVNKRKREYYHRNKELISASSKKRYAEDIEFRNACKARCKKRYESNKEKLREYGRNHYRNNHTAYKRRGAERKHHVKIATPTWSDESKREILYLASKAMDFFNPFTSHEVDHRIPLRGKTVCGLNVENNMQILTKEENLEKRAKFPHHLGQDYFLSHVVKGLSSK